jgi:hypothetical protein
LSSILSQSSSIAIGAQSSLPGSYTSAGSTYAASDQPYINIWNGTSFTSYYVPIATPVPTTGWTAVNAGQMSSAFTQGGFNVSRTTGGNNRGMFRPVPATPYKVMMTFRGVGVANDGYSWFGAYWLDNVSSPYYFTMAVCRLYAAWIVYNGNNFVSGGGYETIYDPNAGFPGMLGPEYNLVFEDDGTSRNLYYGCDAYNYVLAPNWPRSRTDNAAYGYLGFGGNGNTNWSISLTSYREF